MNLKDKKKIPWRSFFIVLISLNLLTVIIISFILTRPIKDQNSLNRIIADKETVEIPFETTKYDLNRMINYYIVNEDLNGPIHYEVLLKDEVEFYGTMSALKQNFQLKITFKPRAMENGDLELEPTSIAMGSFSLPVKTVLNFIEKKYKTPKWIDIRPDDETVYVSLNRMDLKSGIKVKAKQFDLENDDIRMNLLVPVE